MDIAKAVSSSIHTSTAALPTFALMGTQVVAGPLLPSEVIANQDPVYIFPYPANT